MALGPDREKAAAREWAEGGGLMRRAGDALARAGHSVAWSKSSWELAKERTNLWSQEGHMLPPPPRHRGGGDGGGSGVL